MGEEATKKWPSWAIVISVIAVVPSGLLLPAGIGLDWTWAVVAALMLFTFGLAGLGLGKGWMGVLIDPATNTVSLSRLQIMLWTWVVLSAFITVALGRISFGSAAPLNIQLPPLLWALMGISMTSAVGSPLLKGVKAQRTADQDDANQQRFAKRDSGARPAPTYRAVLRERVSDDVRLQEEVGQTKPLGAIVKKDSWQKAALSDVFTGEEVATFGYVDIAKVQNVFFTAVAVVAYAVALVAAISDASGAGSFAFPDVTDGFVAIIGISHAGYLVDKAVTHSTPTDGEPPEV